MFTYETNSLANAMKQVLDPLRATINTICHAEEKAFTHGSVNIDQAQQDIERVLELKTELVKMYVSLQEELNIEHRFYSDESKTLNK